MKMITSNTDKHYLAVSLSGSDDKEVLGKMAEAMFQEGYVTEGFHDAIIQREENFRPDFQPERSMWRSRIQIPNM